MKTIRLTPQQRNDLSDRRRQAQDRRIYQRLSAVLWSDDGRSREEIAELLGVSTRQVGQWFRIFRNKGLDRLCILHYQGDPGHLGPAQVQRLYWENRTVLAACFARPVTAHRPRRAPPCASPGSGPGR